MEEVGRSYFGLGFSGGSASGFWNAPWPICASISFRCSNGDAGVRRRVAAGCGELDQKSMICQTSGFPLNGTERLGFSSYCDRLLAIAIPARLCKQLTKQKPGLHGGGCGPILTRCRRGADGNRRRGRYAESTDYIAELLDYSHSDTSGRFCKHTC